MLLIQSCINIRYQSSKEAGVLGGGSRSPKAPRVLTTLLTDIYLRNIKHFSVLIYVTQHSVLSRYEWKLEKREIVRKLCFNSHAQFQVFLISTSVDITVYQHGKMLYNFFYNIAMLKARRIQKNSVFTSGGKFSVLTLSYVKSKHFRTLLQLRKAKEKRLWLVFFKLFLTLATCQACLDEAIETCVYYVYFHCKRAVF